ARGRTAAFPSLHPVRPDQCRSRRGCLLTMRVRLRGFPSARGFLVPGIAMDGAGVGMPSGNPTSMHLRIRTPPADGLPDNSIAIVRMHRSVAIAVKDDRRSG